VIELPTLAPLAADLKRALQAKIAGKAKPIGALGRLETLAVQIGQIRGTLSPTLGPAELVIFAGDHGLTAEGVAAYPSEISGEIAKLVVAGGAGANICSRVADAEVLIVDAGLLQPLPASALVRSARMAAGTANSLKGPAMTAAQRDQAFAAGRAIVGELADLGVDIFCFGEIGIGNTSAASLIAHAVTGLPLGTLVGAGAGVAPGGLLHKRAVINSAYARAPTQDPAEALMQFAGFEMVMLTGAIIEAAARNRIVLVDGFIVTACAAVACALVPNLRQRLIFAHTSAEAGHATLLYWLDATPLLDLGLRLGEGTGAALAVPLVRAAAGILTDLADLPGTHPDQALGQVLGKPA
jgi:nicotinate-nucleotide--dimethylbenzimidazole phosphoribosyltransferase